MNFYRKAADILDDFKTKKGGSIKSLIFQQKAKTSSPADQKRLYALVSETLKNKYALEKAIENSQLLKIERKAKISQSLALVLVHDLLCSKKGIAAASGGIKDAILRHRTRLKAEFVKAKLSNKNGLEYFLPRWVRVNTLKTTLANIIKKLDELCFVRVTSLEELKDEPKGYMIDANVQNLIAFHHSNDILEKLSQDYATVFQDKASCIPSDLLDAKPGDIALDACAAPGNKTMQVAASIAPSGHVYAVEKDAERFLTLKTRLANAGASEITTVLNADFTNLDPQDERFKSVTHILLDPSCSGSGLIQRLEYDQDEQTSPTRLRNLATFQSRLLKHALSFPNLQRVVYSTCSYHAEENERVLQGVLNEQKEWRVFRRDEQPTGLKSWHRRGLSEECSSAEIAQACIRFEKGTDGTIGFFAVALVRNGSLSNGDNIDEDDEEEEEEEEEWQGIPS